MSFLNWCFFMKVIFIWIFIGDVDYVMIVGLYFYYVGGFEFLQVLDIFFNFGRSDFMYIVYFRKLKVQIQF